MPQGRAGGRVSPARRAPTGGRQRRRVTGTRDGPSPRVSPAPPHVPPSRGWGSGTAPPLGLCCPRGGRARACRPLDGNPRTSSRGPPVPAGPRPTPRRPRSPRARPTSARAPAVAHLSPRGPPGTPAQSLQRRARTAFPGAPRPTRPGESRAEKRELRLLPAEVRRGAANARWGRGGAGRGPDVEGRGRAGGAGSLCRQGAPREAGGVASLRLPSSARSRSEATLGPEPLPASEEGTPAIPTRSPDTEAPAPRPSAPSRPAGPLTGPPTAAGLARRAPAGSADSRRTVGRVSTSPCPL